MKDRDRKMGYLFGPVLSRRLGLSMGVDLLKYKTCNLDCVYCELGRTALPHRLPGSFRAAAEGPAERFRPERMSPSIISPLPDQGSRR